MSENRQFFGSASSEASSDEEIGAAFKVGGSDQSSDEYNQTEKQDTEKEQQNYHVSGMTSSSDDEEDYHEKNNNESKNVSSSSDNEEKATENVNVSFQSPNASESETDEKPAAVGDDLFGEVSDISSDEEEENPKGKNTQKGIASSSDEDEDGRKSGDDENEGANMMDMLRKQQYDEDDLSDDEKQPEAAAEPEATRIEVEIPKITTDLGKKIHFVRFPNFLSVESRPFDATTYEDEMEDDDTLLDEEGRNRLKLKVENTIRWKKYKDENGMDIEESNARMVRWSDGSMSLHLGSEIFDAHQMALMNDHNHLFIRQGTGLQGQAVFKSKLTFRPHSTKSNTHRKMTNRLAMRHSHSQQKVRVLSMPGQDPESRKEEMLRKEEEELKAHVRREALKRKNKEKAHQRGLMSAYVDEEDNENTFSVNAIKNKIKPGYNTKVDSDSSSDDDMNSPGGGVTLQSTDEDSEDDSKKRRRSDNSEPHRKKKLILSDDESEDDVVDGGNSPARQHSSAMSDSDE